MIATTETTIHQAIVNLLVQQGTGRLEAERQWDSIYSKQFHNAAPGTRHAWVIGQYTFEFTKVKK